MATKKISELASKGAELEATDLLEISEYDGVSAYTSKKVTGAEIKTAVQNVLFYNNFASFPVTGSTGYLYIDKATEFVYVWDGASYSQVNSGSNFANTNLTFDNNRTHDLVGYKATLDNAELKIIADANTSGDVPFEVTQADGTTNIMKVKGNREIVLNGSNFASSEYTTTIHGLYDAIRTNGNITTTADFYLPTAGSKMLIDAGTVYVQPQTTGVSSYSLNLRGPGTNEAFSVRGNGYVVSKYTPNYADDASADADTDLPSGALYTTTAGGRTIYKKP